MCSCVHINTQEPTSCYSPFSRIEEGLERLSLKKDLISKWRKMQGMHGWPRLCSEAASACGNAAPESCRKRAPPMRD